MIAVREALGLRRQTFFVSLGSFDRHGGQVPNHTRLLGLLNDALASFQQTLAELGVEDSVTTFTASEFGRTLTINGNGTDHAWATDYMVIRLNIRILRKGPIEENSYLGRRMLDQDVLFWHIRQINMALHWPTGWE